MREEQLNINGLSGMQAFALPAGYGKNTPLDKSPKQEFLAYMEKSPAERMAEAWLRSRGISPEELEQMPPEEREALEKQMAEDIKRQMEQEAREKAVKSSGVNTALPMASFLALASATGQDVGDAAAASSTTANAEKDPNKL
jgi:predicted flavoprotein YhiN